MHRLAPVLAGLLLAASPMAAADARAEGAAPPVADGAPASPGEAPPDAGMGPAALVGDAAPPVVSARTGKAYLQQVCSGCHAVGATGDSPDSKAPAFRDVLKDYPPEDLEESLAEGIVTGHPDMPEVVLDPPQIANIIAYLDALAVVTGP